MKIKWIAALLMVVGNFTAAAQKPFTLEELLGGGKNYWQMQPENKYTTWWGETALETTPEEVKELVSGKTLVTVEQINEWAGKKVARNGHNLIFPYPEKSGVETEHPTAGAASGLECREPPFGIHGFGQSLCTDF